ncbi:MAG: hypothetical protein ACT4QF_13005 [Sporichthyaceae bacterium]
MSVGGGMLLVGAGFQDGGSMRVVGLVLAVPLLALGLRGWFLRIEMGDPVRIVNWIRIVEVPRADIRRFSYENGHGLFVDLGCERVAVQAFSVAMRGRNLQGAGLRAVGELEALRREWADAAGSPPAGSNPAE